CQSVCCCVCGFVCRCVVWGPCVAVWCGVRVCGVGSECVVCGCVVWGLSVWWGVRVCGGGLCGGGPGWWVWVGGVVCVVWCVCVGVGVWVVCVCVCVCPCIHRGLLCKCFGNTKQSSSWRKNIKR